MRRHLLFEHINPVDQLVHHLVTSLIDVFVVSEDILRAYVRRAQVIEEELLEFLPSVVMIDPHWVLSVPGITEEVLKISFCQHNLVFYAPVGYRPHLIHVFTCPGKLLQFKIGFTLIRRDFQHIQLCLLLPSINISEVGGPINGKDACYSHGRVSLAVTCLHMGTSHSSGEKEAAITV